MKPRIPTPFISLCSSTFYRTAPVFSRIKSDRLLENFKVGGLAQYGLDAASLMALNPRLVCCSITGFGQEGPYAARAGYDFRFRAWAAR